MSHVQILRHDCTTPRHDTMHDTLDTLDNLHGKFSRPQPIQPVRLQLAPSQIIFTKDVKINQVFSQWPGYRQAVKITECCRTSSTGGGAGSKLRKRSLPGYMYIKL